LRHRRPLHARAALVVEVATEAAATAAADAVLAATNFIEDD